MNEQTAERLDLRPQAGRQTEFLASPADLAVYGGAAGGGKTWALLLEPLRHIHNPDFGAVIFRRTIPEITHEGALWDEARKIYPLLAAHSNENERRFDFPSGARISFSHMQLEKDKESWKSAQVPLVEFDQLETFSETQFFYMLSRNRSLCGVRPYVRATANPEPGWLADFLAWWIAADGYADLARVGRLRWMVRQDEKIEWADSPAELVERYGAEIQPKSVTFIVSTVYDNKILLAKDPGYLANLQAQDYVDRERLLGDPKRGGNWKVKPAAGKVFNRAWFKLVDAAPAGGEECLFWDFAATEKEFAKPDPDYTAAVAIRRVGGRYTVTFCMAEQLGPSEVERRFVNLSKQRAEAARAAGTRFRVRWEREPGSAGKREGQRFAQLLAGLDARAVVPLGDKLSRAKAFAAQALAANVDVLRADWTERWLAHMHAQPDATHDDLMDASDGSFNDLVADAPAETMENPFY